MSRRRWRFSESEIKRSIKAVNSTGLKVKTVEIGGDGAIRLDVAEVGGADSVSSRTLDDPDELRRLL
jgi:hypothetical protein